MKTLLAALLVLPSPAFAQTEPPRVSLDARGEDVREVLATLFAQARRPYALDASIKGKLYVAFDRMPFPKALGIVLAQANLVARDRDGVTLIAPAPVPMPKPLPVAKPAPVLVAPAKSLPPEAFARRITTRLSRAPLADVFAALGAQAKVTIEVDPAVPAYRVDAFFAKTSLRYALDRVCRAAGLRYEVAEGIIRIAPGAA